jgi:hypothetical protein
MSQKQGAQFSFFLLVARVRPSASTKDEHEFCEAIERTLRQCSEQSAYELLSIA